MDHLQDFALGHWLLGLAYLTSVVGCTLGLACTLQARNARTQRHRLRWLALAALSIGGIGIWLMHFICMLGFATPGMPVRYDVLRTALSAVLAVAAVFGGLLVFGVRTRFVWWRLLLGGLLAGLTVALMHYTGMWALLVQGSMGYRPGLVLLSVVVAVVAATATLWFTVAFDHPLYRLAAGLIMAVAVIGLHYVGMAAMRLDLTMSAPTPAGVEVFSFLFPVFMLSGLAIAAIIYAVLSATPVPIAPKRALVRGAR